MHNKEQQENIIIYSGTANPVELKLPFTNAKAVWVTVERFKWLPSITEMTTTNGYALPGPTSIFIQMDNADGMTNQNGNPTQTIAAALANSIAVTSSILHSYEVNPGETNPYSMFNPQRSIHVGFTDKNGKIITFVSDYHIEISVDPISD